MGWSNASGWMTGAGGWNVAAGGASPVLFTYNFLTSPSLPATLTLSRATTGRYFNGSGVIQSAAIDAARFDNSYNGSAWVAAGLLVEEQRMNHVNLIDLSATGTWQQPGGAITVGTGVAGIDGTSNAFSLTPGVTNTHYMLYDFGAQIATPNPICCSVFAKPNGYTKIALRESNQFGCVSSFNLSGAGSDIGDINAVATAVGTISQFGSWYRPVAKFSPPSNSGMNFGILPLDSAFPGGSTDPWGTYTFAGNGTSGIIAVFPQIEEGSFATSVITTAGATRSADLLSATGTLATQLAAGPSVWELQDQATGAITRTSFAAGAFTFPTSKWYRSFGVYPTGTNTTPYLTVGGPY